MYRFVKVLYLSVAWLEARTCDHSMVFYTFVRSVANLTCFKYFRSAVGGILGFVRLCGAGWEREKEE